MKLQNIRINHWRKYMNENYSEELLDVQHLGGKGAVRTMRAHIPPRSVYEKWIYVNESSRFLKKHEQKICFLVMLYDPNGLASEKEILGKYRNGKVKKCASLREEFTIVDVTGADYIIFLDAERQRLAADALAELADVLQKTGADMVYSDEDEWDTEESCRKNPFFKPDWSPDTFDSFFYTGNLAAYRMDVAREVQTDGDFALDGEGFDACHYRFARAFVKKAGKIEHIPEVLCHVSGSYTYVEARDTELWGSSDEKMQNADVRDLQAVDRLSVALLKEEKENAGAAENTEKISVIIPSKDHAQILEQCLKSLYRFDEDDVKIETEIIVVDNGSGETERQKLKQLSVRYHFQYLYRPMDFNFSAMCNLGAEVATGKYLLFLNDDIEALESGWLQKMKALAEKPHVGAVGAKLYYPGGRKLQHLGVVNLAIGPGHCFLEQEDEGDLYYGRNRYNYNYLAVTAACLMVRKEVFAQVGGFDESLRVAYNDVDFCFSVYEAGYDNVLCNEAVLCHHESLSRGSDENGEKKERLLAEADYLYKKHPALDQRDPFYSPNLTPYLGRFEWNLDDYGSREEHLSDLSSSEVKEFRWDIRQEWLDPGLVLQIDQVYKENGKVCIAGWAYLKEQDNFTYIRRILLRDAQEKCWWIGTRSRYRGYLKEQFPEVKGMDMLAFSCVFDKAALPGGDGGSYQIGMAAESKDGKELHVIFSEKQLEI